jgi:hypothetical protein
MNTALTEFAETAKGDVYEVIGGSEKHPIPESRNLEGVVFRTVKRNTTFQEYSHPKENHLWISDYTKADGYYLIEMNTLSGFETSKASSEEVVGIFVPYGADRKDVADAVRRYFGPGSALVKAPRCGQCGYIMNHYGGDIYKCPNCHNTGQA